MVDHHTLKSNQALRKKLDGLKQEVSLSDLARIPTTLGRLIHLAWLRDSAGLYHDARLAERASPAEVDLVLREIHEEAYGAWLSFSLENQQEELMQHLKSLREEGKDELATWLTVTPYLNLIPASAQAAERALYRSDLEILLDLLKEDLA